MDDNPAYMITHVKVKDEEKRDEYRIVDQSWEMRADLARKYPAYGWSAYGSPQLLVSRLLTLHTAPDDAADQTSLAHTCFALSPSIS